MYTSFRYCTFFGQPWLCTMFLYRYKNWKKNPYRISVYNSVRRTHQLAANRSMDCQIVHKVVSYVIENTVIRKTNRPIRANIYVRIPCPRGNPYSRSTTRRGFLIKGRKTLSSERKARVWKTRGREVRVWAIKNIGTQRIQGKSVRWVHVQMRSQGKASKIF